MSKMLSITKYEYKMQIKRIAGWIVLLFVLVSSMMDCLPVAANLTRIEFLGDIHYYVRRVFSFDGLILLFGILFLTAGRMVDDRKNHRRDLFYDYTDWESKLHWRKIFRQFFICSYIDVCAADFIISWFYMV